MPEKTASVHAGRWHSRGQAMGRWGVLLLGASMAMVGCGRPSPPIRHEVRRPIDSPAAEPELPPAIRYTDIPKVPEELRNPSPPIENGSGRTP